MKRALRLALLLLLVLHPSASPAATEGSPRERSITVHRSMILPDDPLRERIRRAEGARVYRLAHYEPGCPGDPAWERKTFDCYSVRRELRVPSAAWREAVTGLLANDRTYSTQFERDCSGSPEYLVRLESGKEGPVDAWLCLECTQITVTVGRKMRARGGFDRTSGEWKRLIQEVTQSEEHGSRPDWMLADDEFPLEEDTLPVDEPPTLEGTNPHVRILSSGSAPGAGEYRIRMRIDPEGRRVLIRANATSHMDQRHLESLVKGLTFTPARRNGLPVSAWVEIATTRRE